MTPNRYCRPDLLIRAGSDKHGKAQTREKRARGFQSWYFNGHDVSLNSLSDLIVKLALTPGMESRHSLGVSTTTQGGKS